MGITALTIATLCYVFAAIDLARQSNWPMCLTFAAYAVANCGLILASYRPGILKAVFE